MINERVRDALNHQVNCELVSAYRYLAMSSYASKMGLNGAAKWLSIQWEEEIGHAKKIFDYVLEQGEQVILEKIDQPPAEFSTVHDMFDTALKGEQELSSRINELMNVAREQNDNATQVFLQWFVTEQVEEENQARHIIDMLNLAGDEGGGLFLVDKELDQRSTGKD
jgi:ferritin